MHKKTTLNAIFLLSAEKTTRVEMMKNSGSGKNDEITTKWTHSDAKTNDNCNFWMNFNSLSDASFFPRPRIIHFCFGRNYFLMYEFFRLANTEKMNLVDIMNIAENKNSWMLFCCLLQTLFRFSFFFCCHNYVQLQFHKSMIYSYGLHFYSIRLP